ncbi:MAG: efflux RND transporter periplasmic adaptor subunit [Chromatiales bacterium]|nr:efflux RND transporter periplasmic adaptor subunit [Chromatiales bacterium]
MKKIAQLLLFVSLLPLQVQSASPPPARVVTVPVEEQEMAATQALSGIVDFDRISAVSGEVSGLITKLHISEGKQFKAGDPLLELNTDLIRKDIDIKNKEKAQVSADLEKVGRTLKRLESLLQKNSASRQAYDDARFDHRSLQKKRETLDEELQRLKLQLDKSVVRAPFNGIVLEKQKEQGEWLAPGMPVCRLASTEDLVVKVAVSENMAKFQQVGQTIPISINALDLRLTGTVKGFIPVADLRSKSALLKITIPYQPGVMQNMTASAEVAAGRKQTLQMIPRDAVVRMNGKTFVYSIKEDKAQLIPVTIISRTDIAIGVNQNSIRKGMPVVIDGNDRLRPNQAVQVISN